MKNVMRIVLLLLFSIVLVSCGDVAITLDTPTNVAITNGVVTWDAVEGADSYIVGVDTNAYTVTTLSYDLKTLGLAVGDYPIRVSAKAGSDLSLPSEPITYTVSVPGLGIPQNVTITNGVVTWNAVTGATGYTVYVNTTAYQVTATTYDLKTLSLAQGSYNVYVVAKTATTVSGNSATRVFLVGGTTLSVPQNVVLTGNIVTWTAVSGATSYDVHINDTTQTVTAAMIDLSALGLLPGTYTVFVVAKAGTEMSSSSLSVSYTIASANTNTIYSAALLAMNPTYTPNMGEDDFEDEESYREYMNMSQLAQAYSQTAAAMGMSEIEAIAMFGHVASTPLRMASINNISGLMTEIDSYDIYGLDSVKLANMLYELGMVGVSIHMDDLTYKLAEISQEILDEEADLALVQSQVDFTAIRAELAVYASTEQLALLDYFLTGAYDETYNVINTLYAIASDMRWNYEWHYPYYLDDGDEYMQLFYDLFDAARLAENTALLEQFTNGNPLQDVSMLRDYHMSIIYTTERFDSYTNEFAMMTELLAFMASDKTMMVNAFTGVSDYLSLVYDTIPTSLVTLVDKLITDGDLTMEEYFTLKGEVMDVLLTTLPPAEDFASIYTMLFTLGNTFELADFDDYFAYAGFLGDVDYAMIQLGLTFMDEIDQTTVEDVMAIIDGMVTTIDYRTVRVDYHNMSEPQTSVDIEKVIELVVYVGNYLEAFKTNHATMFANLTALQADAQVKELVLLLGETAKAALVAEMDPDEYAMVEMVIDEVLANYDTFMMAADIVGAIGMGVFDEFLTTSGALILDLNDLMNTGSGDLSDQLFLDDLQDVLAQMTDYAAIITTELDSDSIHTLLSVLTIAFKLELMMVSDLDPADIDELMNLSLVPATAALDIVFTMIGYLDDQTIIDMILLVDEMIIPGEYVEDMYGGYYESDSLDFPAAVEFVVYLGTFLQDFKTDNTAKLETFNNLFTDGDIEALLTLFSSLALDQLEPEMPLEEYEMLSMIVADVLADYDDIIAAGAFVKTIGSNLLDEFLITEGAMFLNLYTLMNDPLLNTDDPQFILDLMDIFGQVVNYNSAIMSEMDATSIEQLLRIVKIPLKIPMMQKEGMTEVEYEAFFEALVGPVSTVLANIATVEQALVASLDGMALTIAASATWVNLTEEQKVMALAVKTVDTVLDVHEALIFSTITIIQNDILKNTDVLVLMNTNAVDIDSQVADIVLMLTDIFDEVDVVAGFNFLLITPEQIIQLNDLFAMLPSGENPPA